MTIITYLNPVLGYEVCSAVAKEALQTNRRVYDLILEKELVTQERLDELLLPKNMLKLQK
ncbi:MAG: aspartate ammonia-lyase [Arcobacteraceae bacterium]